MGYDKLAQPSLVAIDTEASSFRVHRDAYRSAEIFEREKAIIFSKCWLYLGHATELKKPGDFVSRRVGGRDLIFLLNKHQEYEAFYNSCTHRGAKICRERQGNNRNFSCPYHGWVFNTEGRLVSMNATSGYAETINADGHLDLQKPARLENYRGFYFVNFNPRAISLYDYLAGARDIIDAINDQAETEQTILPGEHSYTIRANYKFLVENSYDGYHLTSVHASYLDHLRDRAAGTPAAASIDNMLANYDAAGAGRGLGMGHGVLESFVPSGRPVAYWVPSMGPAAKPLIEAKRQLLLERFGKTRADYITDTQKNMVIFPNLVINDILAVTVRVIEPETPNFIRVTAWAMGPREESEDFVAMRLDNFISFLGPAGFGSPDDIEMLEISQSALEHTAIDWSEMSKGMAPGDARTRAGTPTGEVHMQAYWTQWDRVMRGLETLEMLPETKPC
jgi:p-cumate 2,3-dioxygenase alpha subunit